MTSILTSIKKLLGMTEDYRAFDTDIIIHINTVFMTLTQIGVGPKKGFVISSEMETWDNFLAYSANTESNAIAAAYSSEADNTVYLEAVKTYVYLKVKLLFDPPTSSGLLEAMKRQAEELEWRLSVQVENNEKKEG